MAIPLLASVSLAPAPVRAVILLGDGSAGTNTTAPTGDLAGSGWQYQGSFGGVLGTPIAPKFFMTAKHVSGGGEINYEGTNHPVVRRYHDVFSDLTICEVGGDGFATYAGLYSLPDEVGRPLVVFGKGAQRGDAIPDNGGNNELRGWRWGNDAFAQRWGENAVADIVNDGPLNQYLYATFDNNGLTNEAHLSANDSGGAVFIKEGAIWKLAGINYAVDGPFSTSATGANAFDAAFFDASGFYWYKGSYVLVTSPEPSGFYSTRISTKLPWIQSVIAPLGDANGNGIPNRLEYALALNEPAPAGPAAAPVTKEPGFLILTYRKLLTSNTLQYRILQSEDLVDWMLAAAQETAAPAQDEVQVVTAKVPITSEQEQLFLRLEITETAP